MYALQLIFPHVRFYYNMAIALPTIYNTLRVFYILRHACTRNHFFSSIEIQMRMINFCFSCNTIHVLSFEIRPTVAAKIRQIKLFVTQSNRIHCKRKESIVLKLSKISTSSRDCGKNDGISRKKIIFIAVFLCDRRSSDNFIILEEKIRAI